MPGAHSGDSDHDAQENFDDLHLRDCSSTLETDSSDEEADVNNVPDELVNWAVSYNVSRAAMSALLSILKKAGLDLPKDPRVLYETPRHSDVISKAGGEYFYTSLHIALVRC